MSSLLPVLHKIAWDIHPYDAGQTGMIGAGAGALAGAALGGAGGAALGAKGKKTSTALKAALLGALGGGALGGYTGHAFGDKALHDTSTAMFKGFTDPAGNFKALQGQGDLFKDLYQRTGRFAAGNKMLTQAQMDNLGKDTPGKRLGGWMPFTTQDPSENAIARTSNALRGNLEDHLKQDVTLKPGQLLNLVLDRDPSALDTDFSKYLKNTEPVNTWLGGKGEVAPTPEMIASLAKEYQR